MQFSFSQEKSSDSLLLKENRKKLENNIVLGNTLRVVDEANTIYIEDSYYSESKRKLDLYITKLNTMVFPNTAFDIYKIAYSGNYTDSHYAHMKITSHKHFYQFYLIAVSKDQKNKTAPILFISGDFPLSYISKYFKLDEKNIDTFKPYIKMKLFEYNLTKIKCIKTSEDEMYFKAFSTKYKRKIKLKISKFNYDFTTIL